MDWNEIFLSYAPNQPNHKSITVPDELVAVKKEKKVKKKRPRTIIDSDLPVPCKSEKEYVIPKNLPIVELQELEQEYQDDDVFFRRLDGLNKMSNPDEKILYDQSEVLSYVASLEKEKVPVWYQQAQETTLEHGKRYPVIPALSRSYLMDFMRAPEKKNERLCSRNECISERMGGFRCREFYLPGRQEKDKLHGWCIMCHFCVTNELYLEASHVPSFERDNSKIYAIHHFMVYTDTVGEYRLEKTIQGEKMICGLYGPFPVFNVNNYIQDGQSWKEIDALVFRLPQKVSAQRESSPTTKLVTGK